MSDWSVWREYHSVDEFGKHHTVGEWCATADGVICVSQQEAEHLAGVWNVLGDRWQYSARKIL